MIKKVRWMLKEQSSERVAALSKELGISYTVARLLINRKHDTQEKAKAFIKKSLSDLYDPFLIPDMEKGALRIQEAIANDEKITIYGDYDVDGVTSSVIMHQYLVSKGAKVGIYIPDRSDDGYGLNVGAIKAIVDDGTKLIITVDCGITAIEEIDFANSLGIDVIVTDHHECKEEMPKAVAVINPKRPDSEYPFKELAGVGVAFKLICALAEKNPSKQSGEIEKYLELVAFGTIADVMPLVNENRVLVSIGLKKISKTTNVGLLALIEEAGLRNKKITAGTIGYILAPRVNAAGRVSSAMLAVNLLLTDDRDKARELAKELCDANRERQEDENKIFLEAMQKIRDEKLMDKRIIVLEKENWHHGIIGIVASRITDMYYLPSVMISFDEKGEGKGSCRSISSFNMYNALEHHDDYLDKFGGHALAAGISVSREKFPQFKQKIEEYAMETIREEDLEKIQEIDCEIEASYITVDNIETLSYLEPYGMGNNSPVFMCKELKIKEVRAISGGKHTRFTLESNGKQFFGLMFGKSMNALPYYEGEYVDICCSLDISVFKGEKQVQVVLKDLRLSLSMKGEEDRQKSLIEKYRKQELSEEEMIEIAPIKDDFVKIYRAILKQDGEFEFSVLARENRVGLAKFVVCIDVLEEMGLIANMSEGEYKRSIEMAKTQGKINLFESKILKSLGRG